MAKGDRVGALYYEVILDPRGFARGAAKTKHEQEILTRAIKSSITEIDHWKAEQIAISKRLAKATAEERAILEPYYDSLTKKIRRATKAREEEAEEARKARVIEAKRRLFTAQQKGLYRSGHMKGMAGQFQFLANQARLLKLEFKSGTAAASKLFGNIAQAAGLSPMLQGLARTVGLLSAKLAAAVLIVVGLGAAVVKTVMSFDRYKSQLLKLKPLMGGNIVATRYLTERMEDLAKRTVFTVEQLQQATLQMRTMGVAANRIPALAEKFGGIVSGDPERLKLVVKAYTDVLAKGKLMAQEVNQFANAQVPVWQALSDSMGKPIGELRKMAEEGKITASDLDKALDKYAKTIGAEQQLAANLETISGQFGAMGQSVAAAFREAGEVFHDEILLAVKLIGNEVSRLSELLKLVADLTDDTTEEGTPGSLAQKRQNLMLNLADKIATIGLSESTREAQSRAEFLEEAMKQALEETKKAMQEEALFEQAQKDAAAFMMSNLDERLLKEEEIANRKFEAMLKEKVLAEEITEQQAEQVRKHREIVESEIKRREEAEKRLEAEKEIRAAAEEERKAIAKEFEQEKGVIEKRLKDAAKRRAEAMDKFSKAKEDEVKKKTQALDSANQTGGSSFDAGSVAEFQFLRQMELQARRDQMVTAWETQAADDRRAMRKSMQELARNTAKQAQEDVEDLEYSYYGSAGAP